MSPENYQSANFSSDNANSPIYLPEISTSQIDTSTKEGQANKYLKLERESQQFKDHPQSSLFILDHNYYCYNPRDNSTKLLCSRQDRERIFRKEAERLIGMNNQSELNDQDENQHQNIQNQSMPRTQRVAAARNTDGPKVMPLKAEQLSQLNSYVLQKQDFPRQKDMSNKKLDTKRKRDLKKEIKQQKSEQKFDILIEKQSSTISDEEEKIKEEQKTQIFESTGLDFLDEILNGAPSDIDKLLEKYSEQFCLGADISTTENVSISGFKQEEYVLLTNNRSLRAKVFAFDSCKNYLISTNLARTQLRPFASQLQFLSNLLCQMLTKII
ncbi:UNKNOWN [Stylonychia lemnae]|uniref:Uncharacterized protein n=1 Tax=Stylonychia lemnae TaxID=5949 RepID=A0A077ZMM5_STYLE|nr:UNKNOWN [Stylonychia lemnae]|eukprot:CDW71217.1 UNKNOWN [Stylonychia lemnae]